MYEIVSGIIIVAIAVLSFNNLIPKDYEGFILFPVIIGLFLLYSAFDKSILMNEKVCKWMLNSNKKWCD